jgi:hypothetical protein
MFDYKEEINKSINDIITKFIDDVSNKFKIDKSKLINLWECKQSETVPKVDQKLSTLKRKELEVLCKEKGLSITGKKDDLVKRLMTNINNNDKVINTILTGLSSITITKNKFGNYEHNPTKFVFNKTSKIVIGKQEGDKIISLTEADIEICNQYKFKYTLPENLNEEETDGGNVVDTQIEDDVFEEDEEDEEEG